MSSDEQKQILKMVEDGKISADEAMTLIKALEETPAEDEGEIIDAEAGPNQERSVGPDFEEVKARVRRLAVVPLWIGIVFTVLGAYWMYALVQNANYGFWFFFAWFPLLLGILLVSVSAGGMNSRWLYVNVEQEKGEWPGHISFGFPIPLEIIGWFLRSFGQYIRGMNKTSVDEVLMALSMTDNLDEPLIVNVDEGDHGERVQVYIG